MGGLFSGIGGFERAFSSLGHETAYLCEIDEGCRAVLSNRFPGVKIHRDVKKMRSTSSVDVLTAGFPCQDYSPAGKTAGIKGNQGALFGEIVRLLDTKRPPKWVVLENVPFILSLDGGAAMNHIADAFEDLGYRWAYRVVDAISFGIPQRRKRWIFVASRTEDPRCVLFADDAPTKIANDAPSAYGFYWTEGNRGLGLASDAIPPLKVGSAFNIPASPAIWDRKNRQMVTPDIRDAERLQGFPADWTSIMTGQSPRTRWRLVGNAVSVPTARWIANRLCDPGTVEVESRPMPVVGWPSAAFGESRKRREMIASDRPKPNHFTPILDFLENSAKPLSLRATSGFLARLTRSTLRSPDGFVSDLRHHIETIEIERLASTSSNAK